MGLFSKKQAVKREYFGGVVKRLSVDTEVVSGVERVPFEKLERAFVTEPIMFSGITAWQNLISETRPMIYSDENRVQKKIDWIQNKTQFNETMYDFAPRHLSVFGNGFIELLRKGGEEKILDLITDDPKQFEFQTDSMGKILFDNNGRPVGYKMSKGVIQEIPFSRDEMFHLAVNQLNRGEMGIGIVEPVYKDIELKENIEQAKAESAFRQGFALPGVEFGSSEDPPDTEMEEKAKSIAEDMADNKTICVAWPYYFKPKFLEFPVSGKMEETLMYQTKLQSAVLGIPLTVLLNTDEGAGKGLETLIDFLECRLKAYQKSLKIKEIVTKILESDGFEPNFNVKWKPLTEKASKEALMRFYRMARVGMLDTGDQEVKRNIKEMLGMVQDAPLSYKTESVKEEVD